MDLQQFFAKIDIFFNRPFFEKFLTVIFYGPRSAGKSLHQARTGVAILSYLDTLYVAYPKLPQAIIMSNQMFNDRINATYCLPSPDGKRKQRLYYWENILQLEHCPRKDCWKPPEPNEQGVPTPYHRLHDCYILFDDIATIIPADGWADLPMFFRKLFAQAGHNGVHCIANIQDPVSCDINFRRYTDLAVKVQKLFGSRRPEAAKPPVKWIWGMYSTRSVGADELFKKGDLTEEQIQLYLKEHPEMSKRSWKLNTHWIWRKDTEIYNTLQNVPAYAPNKLRHIVKTCIDPNCTEGHNGRPYVHISHKAV